MAETQPMPRAGRRAFFRIARAALVAVAVLLAAQLSCGGDPSQPRISVVEVTPPAASLVVGDTLRLTATARDGSGNIVSTGTVLWSTSEPSVALASISGLVNALAPGTARITATAGGSSGESVITVAPAALITPAQTLVSFTANRDGAPPATQTVAITNGGGGTLNGLGRAITYDSQASGWLTATLGGTTAPTSLTLTANNAGLGAGTYRAVVTLSAPNARPTTRTVDVELAVLDPPVISLGRNTVTFTAVGGGVNPPPDSLNVTNRGGGVLSGLDATVSYAGGQPAGWLAITLSPAIAPSKLRFVATTGTLPLGTFNATVLVTSPVANNSPQLVDVTFNVTTLPPMITLTPATAMFMATTGGANPAGQTINLTNTGSGVLRGLTSSIAYAANQPTGWLAAALADTVAPTTIALAATTGTLPPGTYSATVNVAAPLASNTPRALPVTFIVAPVPPAIALSDTLPGLVASAGNPANVSTVITVTNAGGQLLTGLASQVTYTGGQPGGWLTATFAGSAAPTTLTLSANATTLAVGVYSAIISVTSPVASNAPQLIHLTFTVTAPPD